MDPGETALLSRLDAEFDKDPHAFILASRRPSAKDFQMIGTIIQVYSFAELSARQIIELIDQATPGGSGDVGTRLAPHDVFPKLAEAARRLKDTDRSNLKPTILRAADTIGMHRELRHTLAHWVVRRLDKGRAYLVMSKNAQEGKKRHGELIGANQIGYGIISAASLKRELAYLEIHTHNLSTVALALNNDCETLADMVS